MRPHKRAGEACLAPTPAQAHVTDPLPALTVRETDRPNGAADCNHGWSTGRLVAGGAQPVGAFVF